MVFTAPDANTVRIRPATVTIGYGNHQLLFDRPGALITHDGHLSSESTLGTSDFKTVEADGDDCCPDFICDLTGGELYSRR